MWTAREDALVRQVIDRPRYEVAEAALEAIAAHLRSGGNADETVDGIARVALARISMARRERPSRSRRGLWLARVTSFAFPRTFATAWGQDAAHHLCFTAEITEGTKTAVGRQVELQLPDEDAERLADQILRLRDWRKREQTPPTEGDRVT